MQNPPDVSTFNYGFLAPYYKECPGYNECPETDEKQCYICTHFGDNESLKYRLHRQTAKIFWLNAITEAHLIYGEEKWFSYPIENCKKFCTGYDANRNICANHPGGVIKRRINRGPYKNMKRMMHNMKMAEKQATTPMDRWLAQHRGRKLEIISRRFGFDIA